MKSKKVIFLPGTKAGEIYLPSPKPAKNYIPKWFKDLPAELPKIDNSGFDKTSKLCIPFLDSFTSGYIQELMCDIKIEYVGTDQNGNDAINYTWFGDDKPMGSREEDFKGRRVMPNFPGYYNTEFHWMTSHEPKTPEGYSSFYFHPSNRIDLPFYTFSGIIDTDKFSQTGALPFMIRRGFEGVIPAGTPIYQIIFIKRDSWKSSLGEYDAAREKQFMYNVKKYIRGGYKKHYWSKKTYE